ncbi:hypothetical protein BDY19DRAFT_954640 [Irpex rosettiformis]|uniref:Uncharacterized protein n=1 Tax=Irpex rosettiformis TaxID=378272 RepID=A0ACB8U038_9APHY|nr:hypothetical protein BDY19DRAFT_954640 [Irpex rosettiformis]
MRVLLVRWRQYQVVLSVAGGRRPCMFCEALNTLLYTKQAGRIESLVCSYRIKTHKSTYIRPTNLLFHPRLSPHTPRMSDNNDQKPEEWDRVLEDEFYQPDEDAIAFFKKETGITDSLELKQHVIRVQKEAFSIFPYPCIRVFGFTWMKFAHLPAYELVLQLGRERKEPLFLDLGCCLGNDLRKLVQDGYPIQYVIASDLRQELWDLGHKLFRSTQETYPARFISGDVFDSSFLAVEPPMPTSSASDLPPVPDLSSINSLNALRGRVSAIYIGAFFHLFSEEKQHFIAKLLAGLLSPEPGSIIAGVQGGAAQKGFWKPTAGTTGFKMFCHSPESWSELWHDVFTEGKGGDGGIEVHGRLRKEIGGDDYFKTYPGNTDPYYVLEWYVVRK